MRNVLFNSVLISSLIASSAALAGAGANIYACVYMKHSPASPMKFHFQAGDKRDFCMLDIGKHASLTVTKSGVSCVSVGYVESKSSGSDCAFDRSLWNLGYYTHPFVYSGATRTRWSYSFVGDNYMRLFDMSPNTSVCKSPRLCKSTTVFWSSTGHLYIIFQPQPR